VKSIRAGRVQLKEAYVVVKNGAVYLIGCHISPLPTASTHIYPDPTRSRKLLLHASEINKLIGKTERAGFTLVPLDMHYVKGRIKLEIGLAKGKKQHDKRRRKERRKSSATHGAHRPTDFVAQPGAKISGDRVFLRSVERD
jgi:SsrA-binding protein